MMSIEAFARKGEKNMLKNMFKEDGASSDSSMSDSESEIQVEVRLNGRPTSSESEKSKERELVVEETKRTSFDKDRGHGGNHESDELMNGTALGSSDALDEAEKSIELYHSNRELFTISMLQQKRKGIAHQLWPAATYLSKYMESHLDIACRNRSPENMNVLELGAGIGLCGLVCSKLNFKKVILTDLPVALELLQSNIQLNKMSNTYANVLSWGCQEDALNVMNEFDQNIPLLVIAADCVYWEILFKPLCDTIKQLITNFNAEVIISHVKRWKKDEKFFRMCRKIADVELLDEVRELIPAEHTGVPTRVIKRIYRIKAK